MHHDHINLDPRLAHVEHGSPGCTCVTDPDHVRFGEDPNCPHHGYEDAIRRLEAQLAGAVNALRDAQASVVAAMVSGDHLTGLLEADERIASALADVGGRQDR